MSGRRQRGSISARLRTDGTRVWDIRFRDASGKPKHCLGGTTKKEAAARLNEILLALQRGIFREVKPIRFRDYAGPWLAARQLKPSTRHVYESIFGVAREGTGQSDPPVGRPHQLLRYFGGWPLDAL